jgi:hypothetical protein
MFRATSLFRSLDDLPGDDTAVRLCDLGLLHLARNAFCDEMPEAKADLCDLDGRDSRCKVLIAVMGKDCDSKSARSWRVQLEQPDSQARSSS